ncbi:S-ribosylhomocysteine lyase [Helicobacter sp. CLO-3]|uniref:menaquinone biosynthesis family protein n=1 Tax=unclassified Helicobacter TaxID=2593540 RepID=UPI0008050244|nr:MULTISPECIES: MqnA/MqnD/SBP family protein [unclassified Helicobacter]OBV30050.1 S-ribosylhomocysteine lyase [Helicobacter sp. CLO-3]OHU82715.1 S-ribosylhomocysteine lyase [Helicobacter sp. CLO-3]
MIQVAHSPDADDIFMYYAIAFGWVDSALGLRFSNIAQDIETLNQATIKQQYDASAISFALYPLVCDSYALLRTGVSFGNGYGPKLIRRKDSVLKRNFKVALSGAHTTNALLFKLAYPNAKIVYRNFLDIEGAVLSGEVDAGVLIHESILHFSDELVVEAEIWDIWHELAKDELPLPLGGMALRRSIPLNKAIDIESTLTKAVQIATQNKSLLSKMLLSRGLIRVDAKALDTYLNLYANDESISLSEKQILAIDKLFALGFDAGIYPQIIKSKDYMIPCEYAGLRHS